MIEDYQVRLSTQSGSAGDSEAGEPAGSTGKYMATTELVDGALDNLFPDISQEQVQAGVTIDRCIFVLNNGAESGLTRVWIESQVEGGGFVSLALDPTGVSARDSAPVQAQDDTSGLMFSAPHSANGALTIGNLDGDECAAVWLRLRVDPDPIAVQLDGLKLAIGANF